MSKPTLEGKAFDERWLSPGGVVPVDPVTTGALVNEIQRLRDWHKQRNSYDEHPARDLTRWRVYDRMPFQIGHHACVQVVLWKRHDYLEDIWLSDHNDQHRSHWEMYQRAAEQFHKQLEGHDCVAFWQALKAEAEKVIEAWEQAKAQTP